MSLVFKVELTDGTVSEVEFDIDRLTLQESVRLEETLGGDAFDELMTGRGVWRPSTLRALVHVLLSREHPGIDVTGFDLELPDLADLEAQLSPDEMRRLRRRAAAAGIDIDDDGDDVGDDAEGEV